MRSRIGILCLTLVPVVAACQATGADTTTATTTTVAETTTSTIPNPFLDLEDEPSNFAAGDVVDVVGLAYDQQNWAGSFPADDVPFFGRVWEFDRLDAGLVASGRAASYLGGPAWEEFLTDDSNGYLPQENTGVVGPPEEVTPIVDDLEAGSADDLIALVADVIATSTGLRPVQITQREFGGRVVYYDLVGSEDPAIHGLRLKIVVEEVGDIFQVVLVEQSIICTIGFDESGECAA